MGYLGMGTITRRRKEHSSFWDNDVLRSRVRECLDTLLDIDAEVYSILTPGYGFGKLYDSCLRALGWS